MDLLTDTDLAVRCLLYFMMGLSVIGMIWALWPEKRRSKTMIEPRKVICPECKAVAGSPCYISESNRKPITVYHEARNEAARNTPREPQGAAFKSLMEEESKESLALQVIKLAKDLHKVKGELNARQWHDLNCVQANMVFDDCGSTACSRARMGLNSPIETPVAGEDFHFSDSQILAMITATDYYKNQISHCLHTLTSGEKWSLYRAVVALADTQRKERA